MKDVYIVGNADLLRIFAAGVLLGAAIAIAMLTA